MRCLKRKSKNGGNQYADARGFSNGIMRAQARVEIMTIDEALTELKETLAALKQQCCIMKETFNMFTPDEKKRNRVLLRQGFDEILRKHPNLSYNPGPPEVRTPESHCIWCGGVDDIQLDPILNWWECRACREELKRQELEDFGGPPFENA